MSKVKRKNVLLKFDVLGIKYDGCDKKLNVIIEFLKENNIFYNMDKYDGYKNKKILEEFYKDDKIYEFLKVKLPLLEFVDEPTNFYDNDALSIWAGNNEMDFALLGYVPNNLHNEVRKLIKNLENRVEANVIGGKYKTVKWSADDCEDKVVTKKSDYGIEIEIYNIITEIIN